MPLPLFVVVGSFIEEILAPIPAPIVMTTGGAAAFLQDYTLFGLFFLAIVGAFGKTLGAYVIYFVADKGEDFTFKYLGKYLPITHEEIEAIGRRFRGGLRDFTILAVLRSIPFVPSVALDVGAGVIKLPLTTYLSSTYVGFVIRGYFFLFIGYEGIESYRAIMSNFSGAEFGLQLFVVVILIGFLIYSYAKRKENFLRTFLNRFLEKDN